MRGSVPIVVAFAALAAACTATQETHPNVPLFDFTQVQLTSGRVAPGSLDDPQRATVAEALRDGIEERARVAVDRARSWQVRAFARKVLADDPGIDVALMTFGPRSSVLADEVTSDTTFDTNRLGVEPIDRFDCEFLLAEGRALDAAAATLHDVVIPGAQDARLRKALFEMAVKVNSDAHDARELLGALAPPTAQPPPP